MRQHLIALTLLAAASSRAGAAPKSTKLTPRDISADRGHLDVYRDENGRYYVSPRTIEGDDARLVFYGDGKTMYEQVVIGSGSDGNGLEWYVWSPRVVGLQNAGVILSKDHPYVECKSGEKRALTLVPADQAAHLLATATFMPPLWQRRTELLARDDDGVYYFVDHLDEDYGGKDYHVYVGPKGAMKEQPMTNVVSDSAGAIFATKRGELRIISSQNGQVQWRKGAQRSDLVRLEPSENRYLIYRDLGIYGQLGTACEDQ